jgi:plasmid maintenance system killer protein
MKINVRDKKLRETLEDEARCKRRYGAEMTKKITLRFASLAAARSLGDFWPPMSAPERCHELQADLKGVFSMDLKHPYRLLFEASEAASTTPDVDQKQRWHAIEAIDIIDIKDTHG